MGVRPVCAWNTLDGQQPVIIGHRGAPGYLPDNTLESYALAITQGADFIEPDLVMTKDGSLICRHEPVLDDTTDVASKFGTDRMVTRMLDGVSTTAYFADTFTLDEIKTLRAVQSRPDRDQGFNGLYGIPTLDDVIALAKSNNVGICPELKHSTYMATEAVVNGFTNTYFEDSLVATLHSAYGNSASAPVVIQSFETKNLRYLNEKTAIRLEQLVDAFDVNPDGSPSLVAPYRQPYDVAATNGTLTFADMVTPAGLATIKQYADIVSPWKPYLVKTVAEGGSSINDRTVVGSTGVIEAAHQAGLQVYAFTFRNDDNQYGFAKGPAGGQAEIEYYLSLGVDGVFADYPDTALAAVAAVPEPETWVMLASGLVLIGIIVSGQAKPRGDA
jgi:glycerophosphoryl diester phosphodiesterase